MPATVQAVLAARIDRLLPEEKQLLQTAAVIGTKVPFPLLQAIGTGLGVNSSTGFTLPNGAKRSPAVVWVKRFCWEALTVEAPEELPPCARILSSSFGHARMTSAPCRPKCRHMWRTGHSSAGSLIHQRTRSTSTAHRPRWMAERTR